MAELSAYEAKRRQRMEENRAALLALQIERLPAPKRPRRDVKKEIKPRERRQSSRLRGRKVPVSQPRKPGRQLGEYAIPALPATLLDLPVVDLNYTASVARAKTMKLDIRVEAFHEQWLGKQLVPVGKNPVLQAMVGAGVEAEKKLAAVFGQTLSVQQFGNALALFVNIKRGDNYDNVFQAAGDDSNRVVFFRWFARNSWYRETPVIQRLLRVRRGDKRYFLKGAGGASVGIKQRQAVHPDEPLLLFLQNTEMDPFVYCGRLGFLGMRAAKSPLEFRWQLLDADALGWMNASRQVIDNPIENDSTKAAKL